MAAKRKVGVLTRNQIISEGVIAEGSFLEDCVQSASYSLRLGNDYYVPRYSVSDGVVEQSNSKVTERDISHCEDCNNVLRIQRYSNVVFSTEEVLNMPDNVVGRFDLRPKYAMQGLVLQVGAQVEPAYKGRLFGLLLNFSSDDILIPRGEKLLSIEFSYLFGNPSVTEEDKREYGTLLDYIGGKATLFKGALEVFQKQMEDRLKLMGSAQTERWRRRWNTALAIVGIFVAIVIPVIMLFFTQASYERGSFPSDVIEELRENNNVLRQENNMMKQNLHDMEAKIDSLALRNNEVADTVK